MRPLGSGIRKTFLCVCAISVLAADIPAQAKNAGRKDKGFQISEVRLYTVPAQPVCGEPVRLVTEIHTTKPGKVDFTLFRRVGRGQKATLTTDRAGDDFVQRWSKEFTYVSSVRREYMVVVKSHEFSTSWVPVDVTCEAGVRKSWRIAQN